MLPPEMAAIPQRWWRWHDGAMDNTESTTTMSFRVGAVLGGGLPRRCTRPELIGSGRMSFTYTDTDRPKPAGGPIAAKPLAENVYQVLPAKTASAPLLFSSVVGAAYGSARSPIFP